jgi:hypothetical protein
MIMSSDNKTGTKRPLKGCLAVFLGLWALLLCLPGRGEGGETGVSLDKAAKAILKVSADEVERSQIIDMEKEQVVESAYADSIPLGPPKIDSLELHVSKVRKESLRRSFKETNLTNLTKVKGGIVGEGLIPDIPLPLGSELKVGGSEKITFGGRRDYSPERQQVETYRQSAFPDLQMKQELQVNLEGIVAKKVHVLVDQNSKRESDLKNTIRINYQGDEDEVVKSIEAGNTDISLPGTQFVGFSGTHKGLFGIKAQAELGGLQLTGIASKEEGTSEKASFVGKSKIDTVNIEDWRFAARQFFSIGLLGDSLVPNSLRIFISTQPNSQDWQRLQAKGVKRGVAYIDPENPRLPITYSGDSLHTWFATQFSGLDQDFTLLTARGDMIAMNSPIQDGVALGACYRVRRGGDTTSIRVGRDDLDSLILKLLKPGVPDSTSLTNSLMLKNVYDLGSKDIGDSIHIRVLRQVSGGVPQEQRSDGVSYALALEIADANGWNLIGRGTFLPQTGVLELPFVRPFDSESVAPDRNPQIYDLNLSSLNSSYTKYTIEAIFRRKRTSFNLGHTDILKGSESVTLNGRKLTRDSDYRIDYDTGELTFMSNVQSELERPDSQINVDFDYAPFLALASKSIVGVRGLYKFGEESQLGGTYIARSERTPELRPRLGEEPYRNTMAEMDLTLKSHPEWMTTAMNKLPLVETEAPSNFTFSGEVAQSYPNPNTIGEVYIDDMEGAKSSTSLGIQRTDWSLGSAPKDNLGRDKDTLNFDPIYWNNPSAGVKAREINPNLTGLEGDETRTVLRLHTIPSHGADTSSWGGIMRVLSTAGEDFTQAKLLSLWIKSTPDTASRWKPKLHVELGTTMNEDAPWRRVEGGVYTDSVRQRGYGYLDAEAISATEWNQDKDVGLDGVRGADGEHGNYPLDSGNDDYPVGNPNPDNWQQLNGTEGNLRFDTEDLNGDGTLGRSNDYYAFAFDLTKSDNSPVPRYPGDWQHFVLAITDPQKFQKVGNPDWKRTIYTRMWLTGFPHADSVSIAEVEVVGNRWLNDGIAGADTSEKFNVDVINNQENPEYSPPFDPGRDERNLPRREQSLAMRVDNLGRGHRALAHQALFEAQDYTGYRTLTFYVHGAPNASPTFFFRMGVEGTQNETTNYYEYRTPIPAGTGWQTLIVDLERMTHLKTLIPADSAGYSYQGEKEDGPYRMKVSGLGPSLVGIRRLTLGLENDTLLNSGPIWGELWVDELRLESVRKERGTAARASMEMQFADLLGVRGDYTYKDSQFHGLTERAGQGFTSSNLGLTSNLSLGKVLPNAWGVNLPLSASNIETKSLPRFSAGSDVILSQTESGSKRSLTIDRRADLSFNKTGRGGRWWTRWTVDRWTAQASWAQRKSDTETGADTSRTTNGSFSYNLTPEKKSWTLFKKLKLYYLPSNLSVSTAYSKLIQRSYTRFVGQLSSLYQRNLTGAMQLGYQPIENVDYGLTVNRDLTRNREGGLWERRMGIGIETGRDQRVSARYSPPVARWLSPNFGYTANYREDHSAQIRTSPDSFDIRNVSMTSNATIGASLSLSTVVRVLTRLRNIGVPKDSVEARDKRILKEGGPWWAFVKLERLADRFKILQATFSQDRSSQANGLDRRPGWEYMVGLRDGVAGVPRHQTFYQDQFNRANSFSLSSGATFTAVDIQASYSRQNSKTEAAQSTNTSESRKWPDVDVSLSALERLPPLKRLASSASLRSSYAVTKEQSGNGDQGAISKKRTREFSPVASVQMVWKKGMTTTVTVNDRRTVEDRFQGDWPKNVNQSRDFAVQFGYSLAGGIKLFPGKKLKFKSNLDLTSSLTYTITLDSTYLTQSQNQTAYENTNTTSLSFKPTASYNFSSSITGGADAEYTTEKNRKAQLSRKVIGLNVWAQFKF